MQFTKWNSTWICRINTPRKMGGLGEMKIPLLADLTKSISQDYGVLKEDDGIAFRSDDTLTSPATRRVVQCHWAFTVFSDGKPHFVSQGSVRDRRQGHPEADHCQRLARRPLGGWNSAFGPGLPVHWQKWRRWAEGDLQQCVNCSLILIIFCVLALKWFCSFN